MRARGWFSDGDGNSVSLALRAVSLAVCASVPPAFSFLLHLSALPSSLPLPPATCAFVYAFPSVVARISVWSGSGGFVVMTTNPGNPAALSHSLWLSRGSLSIRSPPSLSLSCLLLSFFIHIDDSLAHSQKHSFSSSFHTGIFSLFPSLFFLLCSHANFCHPPVASTRAFVRACSRTIHLSRARRVCMYVRLCRLPPGSSTSSVLSLAAAPCHPCLRGWWPPALRYARSPSRPEPEETTETRRRTEEEDSTTSSTRKLEAQR